MKTVIKIIAGLVLLLILLIGILLAPAAYQKRKFIKETVAILSTVNSPADIQRISPVYRPDLILVRQFKNGGWAAVRALDEHETEFGFTAAVIYSGNGNFWLSKYAFCGYEGLESEMTNIKADTLEDFISITSGKFGFSKFDVR